MRRALETLSEPLDEKSEAAKRVAALLTRASATAQLSSWPGTQLAADAPAPPNAWVTWRFAPPAQRALLVQLAPRARDATSVDVYVVTDCVRRLVPRGAIVFRRRIGAAKITFPTVVLDGVLTLRAVDESAAATKRCVFAVRSCLWTSRCYHGAVDTHVERARHARAFVECVHEHDRILVCSSEARLDIVYVPLQAPSQVRAVESGARPARLRGLALDGAEYWPADGLHVVGADSAACWRAQTPTNER